MPSPYELHKKFVQLGSQRHKLKNEMLLILPQIYQSGIYKNYASSIVEYAGKYGDIARSTVIKRLRLEENLEGKPFLKATIKEVGIHKVALVVKLATPESDEAFADKVKNMSKSAIQTLSKELRQKTNYGQDAQLFQIDKMASEGLNHCQAVPQNIKIELDSEMTFLFLKLKQKMGKNLNNQEATRIILKKLDDKGKVEKPRVRKKASPVKLSKAPRHISAEQNREIEKQTNGRCSYPGCNKPAEARHHKDRFSKSKNHSSVILLCRDHHEFMHNGLVPKEREAPANWQLNIFNIPTQKSDVLYREYRRNGRADF